MSKRNFINQRGQTLVDLVVALALLSSSVASAGILSTASSRSSAEAGRRSQATALADREIEGLRSLRDQTERGADGAVGWSTTAPFNSTSCQQFTMQTNGSAWITANMNAAAPVAYMPTDFIPAVSTYSGFSRLVRICPSNEYQQPNNDMTVAKTVPPITRAFTVTVTVDWSEGNGPQRQVVLSSLLSDYIQ